MSGNLFEELKRRQVFKIGAADALVEWLTVQAALLRAAFAARVGTETAVIVGLDPVFDPIRKDPAFATLIAGKAK